MSLAGNNSNRWAKIIAFLLLIVIANRGYEAYKLCKQTRDIEALEEFKASLVNSDPVQVGKAVAKFEESHPDLTTNQTRALSRIRSDVNLRLFYRELSLTWPDGRSLPIGEARGIIGLIQDEELRLVLAEDGELQRHGDKATINGRIPDGHLSWSFPVKAQNRRSSISIQFCPTATENHDVAIQFQLDNSKPRITFRDSSSKPLTLDPEDGRLGLRPGEVATALVLDETLIRRVVLTNLQTNRVHTWSNRTKLTVPLRLPKSGSNASWRLEAEDWAGNMTVVEFEVGPKRRPVPALASITCEGQDLLKGRVRSNQQSTAIEVTFKDSTVDRELHIRSGDTSYPLLKEGDHFVARNITLGGGPQWQGELVLKQIDRELTLASLNIFLDREAPRISVLDDKGGPVLMDTVEVKSGATWMILVEDNDELDRTRTRAETKGSLSIPSKRKSRSGMTYKIKIDGEGQLTIEAADRAGNKVTRTVHFSPTSMTTPNDGQGPKITLYCQDRMIPEDKPVFFWQNAPKLRLEIEDPVGVDPASLRLERCSVGAALPEQIVPRLVLPLAVESTPLIAVKDVFGNETQRGLSNIQVVTGSAHVKLDDQEPATAALPLRFHWGTSEVVPDELLSMSLVDPQGDVHPARDDWKVAARSGLIKSLPAHHSGTWKFCLEFRAFDGSKHIAHQEFTVALSEKKEQ